MKNVTRIFLDSVIKNPVLWIFLLILLGVSFNSIFNSLAVAFGSKFPKTSFLFNPNDLFADYFKFIFSYPFLDHLKVIGTSNLLDSYLINNPTGGVEYLFSGRLSHFHVPPLTTVFILINLTLMNFFDPRIIFALFIYLFIYLFYKIIQKSITDLNQRRYLMASFLLSYPVLFCITRGNVYAAFTSLLIITSVLLLFLDKRIYLALFLLAIAVNIRPNSAVFIFALLITSSSTNFRSFLYFSLLTGLIFLGSLLISNYFYPHYTIPNFLKGLEIYRLLYVEGDGGLAYGSSMFGMLKAVFSYNRYLEVMVFIYGMIILSVSSFLLIRKKLSRIPYIFILTGLYTLCSSVFADYHLIVFWSILIALSIEKLSSNAYSKNFEKKDFIIVYFTTIFLLIPKNYIFIHGCSLQVIFNPLAILISIVLLLIGKTELKQTNA